MDPIHNRIQLIKSALRSQAIDKGVARPKTATAPRQPSPSSPQDEMARLVAKRIQSISADDPERERKVFRAFLESVFAAEFGGQISGNPKFGELVSSVQSQMEADAELGPLIQAAVDSLSRTDPA